MLIKGNILSFYFTCRFKTIAKHKTAYYSFYLPVALAMHMVSYVYDIFV